MSLHINKLPVSNSLTGQPWEAWCTFLRSLVKLNIFFYAYEVFLLVVSHSLFHSFTPSFSDYLLNKIPADNPL